MPEADWQPLGSVNFLPVALLAEEHQHAGAYTHFWTCKILDFFSQVEFHKSCITSSQVITNSTQLNSMIQIQISFKFSSTTCWTKFYQTLKTPIKNIDFSLKRSIFKCSFSMLVMIRVQVKYLKNSTDYILLYMPLLWITVRSLSA